MIGPIAAVDAFIVGQSRLARGLVWDAVLAFQEAGGALVTVRVNAEGKLAAWSRERNLVVFASPAVDGPVVVAVVVDGAFAVEQEAVFALLKGQRTWKWRKGK